MTDQYTISIPGYGEFEQIFESRQDAETFAQGKARWEGARCWHVWRSDCLLEYDQITRDFARRGKAPVEALRRRAELRKDLAP